MRTLYRRLLLTLMLMLSVGLGITAQDQFTVVIDAGHGGKDPGAVSGKCQEKSINLKVALKLGELIEKNCSNVKVIYTRKTDVFVELYRRAEIANKADADFFISIHTNAAKSTSAHGAETYLLGSEENRTSANLSVAMEENRAILLESDYEAHYEGYDPNSPESQIIFEFMQNEYQKESLGMATLVQEQLVGHAKRFDHGVHQAGYLVLWKSAMPSILVELGYISNQTDRNYLISSKGVEELSFSIYKAFNSYLTARRQQEAAAGIAQAASGRMQASSGSGDTGSAKVNNSDINGQILFKVQFLTSQTELPANSSRLKGISEIDHYRDGKLYKYTSGCTSDYAKAQEHLKKIRKIHKDAFIVAFKDGRRVDLQEAIKESQKSSAK